MLTLEELEEELVFQQVLTASLEPDAPDYDESKARIEQEIAHLQRQIEALTHPAEQDPPDTSFDATSLKRSRTASVTSNDGSRVRKHHRPGLPNASQSVSLLEDDEDEDDGEEEGEDEDEDDEEEQLPIDISEILNRRRATLPQSSRPNTDMIRQAAERARERERERERQRAQTRADEEFARQLERPNMTSATTSSSSTTPFVSTFRSPKSTSNHRGAFKSEGLVQRSLQSDGTLQHPEYMPSSSRSSFSPLPPVGSRLHEQKSGVKNEHAIGLDQRRDPYAARLAAPETALFSLPQHRRKQEHPPAMYNSHLLAADLPEQSSDKAKSEHSLKHEHAHDSAIKSANSSSRDSSLAKAQSTWPPSRFVFDMTQSNSSSSSLEEIPAAEYKPNEKAMAPRRPQAPPFPGYYAPMHNSHSTAAALARMPSTLGDVSGGLYGSQSQYTATGSSLNNLYGTIAGKFDSFSKSVAAMTGRYMQIPGMPSSSSMAAASAYDGNNYLYADSSRSPEEHKMLLDSIRGDAELPAHMRKGTPEEMSTILLEHQKLGLTWLMDKEEKLGGSILADDMGLGKTIQALALMVSRPSDDPRRKTTLIVAPVALMSQWEGEIEDKIKKRHRLSVYRYHGSKKVDFSHLRTFDVVITTYGSLTSEFKRHEKMQLLRKEDPRVSFEKNPKYRLALIGDDCHWHRVILDEAQNIKNKNAICSKAVTLLDAKYRLCLTGTPLQNNVDELYPLLRFTRLKPYCHWEEFREISFRLKGSKTASDMAFKKLQALIRATMLRRTKNSKLDGKPLITLPERFTKDDSVTFSAEEQTFYTDLQTKNQAKVQNMITKGVLGKKYSDALTLLLRLRQACDHPSLVFFSESAATMERLDGEPDKMADLAKELAPDVVDRIKAAETNFDCPICFDATENPAILLPCGHWLCLSCFAGMKDSSSRDSEDQSNLRCPQCRGQLNANRITDYQAFKQVHQPELLTAAERAALDPDGVDDDEEGDGDSDNSDSDTESDAGSETDDETLGGFIVKDEGEEEDVDDETLRPRRKARKVSMNKFVTTNQKGKKPARGKGQGSKEDHKGKSLAQLKKEGMRSRAARRRYFKRLEKWYKPSAKIERTIELLEEIGKSHPGEKVLIFSQFTSFLDLLEIGLRRENYKLLRYDGSMTTDERTAAVQQFKQDRSIPIMLLSLKAGNAGLNLNFASHVLILDPFWHSSIEDQAADRAHRIGQRNTVHVHRVIVPGTVEDRILALQEEKRAIINAALDENAGKKIGRLGTRELAFLFGLDESGRQLPAVNRPLLTGRPSAS